MITVSGLAATLFLGGWRAPWPISVWPDANTGWWPLLWFLGKVSIFMFVFIWLRGTLPRIRYDQLMRLGWKVLIPGALAWTLMIATIRVWRRQGGSAGVYIVGGAIIVVLMLLAWALGHFRGQTRRQEESEADAAEAEAGSGARGVPCPAHGPAALSRRSASPSERSDAGRRPSRPRHEAKEVTGA